MPTPPEWTVNASGLTGKGRDLAGCHIFLNSSNFTFTKPNNELLATSSDTTLPATFSIPDYKDIKNWTVTVQTAVNGGNASGQWSFPEQAAAPDPADTPAESGSYTAQTGSGLGGDATASSAKA